MRIPRAVSLCQPAASLVAAGAMPDVVMAWGVDYRGPLLIHASVRYDECVRVVCNASPYRDRLRWMGYGTRAPLPLAALVGRAELVAVRPLPPDAGDPAEPDPEDVADLLSYKLMFGHCGLRRYAWTFAGPVVVHPPVACADLPGLFRVAPAVVAAVECAEWLPTIQSPAIVMRDTVLAAGGTILGPEHDRHGGTALLPPRRHPAPAPVTKRSRNAKR